MGKEGLGYRPHVEREILDPEITQADLNKDINRINAMIKDLDKQRPVVDTDKDTYTWDEVVTLSKQEEVDAVVLDKMIDTVYELGADLEARAELASELIKEITEPIATDDIFKEDTKNAAILLFADIDADPDAADTVNDFITPEKLECIMTIMSGNADQTQKQERATVGPTGTGKTDRVKFTAFDGVGDVVSKVKMEAPKFGMEFFILLAFLLIETIIGMILKPLCPLVILWIPVGKLIAKLVANAVYGATLTFVDIRDVCKYCNVTKPKKKVEKGSFDDKPGQASKQAASAGCDDGSGDAIQERLSLKFKDIQAALRGPLPGYGFKDEDSVPICEDPRLKTGERKPNAHELAAATQYKRAVEEFTLRNTDTNKNHENLSAYMKARLAKEKGFAIKASAGNIQDSIRVSGGKSPSRAQINKSINIQGPTPFATMLKPKFQKPVLQVVNQMLQNVKAVDNMIKSVTSLAFLDSRVADLVCCFIRLVFALAVKMARDNDQQLTKFAETSPSESRGFADFIKEMASREFGTDLGKEFKKTREQLANDPNMKNSINEIVKVIKVLEAILSGLGSTVSADLSFALDIDPGMLANAIIGAIGNTLSVAVDAIMSEVRKPVQDFLTDLLDQPDTARALEECDIFKLMMGFLTCGVDAMHNMLLRLISGFQRDINDDWLKIGASIQANYNKKLIKILRDILNIILNDFYALFTICNIDRMYTQEELAESAKNIYNALEVQKQIEVIEKPENEEIMNKIYNGKVTFESKNGSKPGYDEQGSIIVGEIDEISANNAADDFMTNTPFDFAAPLQNVLSPLLSKDVSAMTADDPENVEYNKKQRIIEPTETMPTVLDKIVEQAVINCDTCTTGTLLNVAFGLFEKRGTFRDEETTT